MRSGSAALSSADPPDDSSGSECESGRARAADDSSGCDRARAADVVGNGSRGTERGPDLVEGDRSSDLKWPVGLMSLK